MAMLGLDLVGQGQSTDAVPGHYESACEVIKLLEQQRAIYRELTSKCKCLSPPKTAAKYAKTKQKDRDIDTINKLKDEIRELDDDIERAYYRYHQAFKLNNPVSLNNTPVLKIIPSPILGIDVNSLIQSPAKAKSRGRKRKRNFARCKKPKCGFAAINERAYIKHQLEHGRDEFLSMIEPKGFRLSEDNSSVVPREDRPSLGTLDKCFFPLCDELFEGDDVSRVLLIAQHLTKHISSYITFPCLNCFKMFESNAMLHEHLHLNANCYYHSKGKYDSLDSPVSKRFRCKMCTKSESYPTMELLRLHINLLHSDRQGGGKVDYVHERDYIEETTSIYCNLCQVYFEVGVEGREGAKEDHAKMVHQDYEHNSLLMRLLFGEDAEQKDQQGSTLSTTIENVPDLIIDGVEALETASMSTISVMGDEPERMDDVDDDVVVVEPGIAREVQIGPEDPLMGGACGEDVAHEDGDNLNVMNFEQGIEYEVLWDNKPLEEVTTLGDEYLVIDNSTMEQLLQRGDFYLSDKNPCDHQEGEGEASSSKNDILVDDTSVAATSPLKPKVTVVAPRRIHSIDPVKLSQVDGPKEVTQLMNTFIFECSKCPYSFRSERELEYHNYAVHRLTSFCCKQCNYVTQDVERYRHHRQVHAEERAILDKHKSRSGGGGGQDNNTETAQVLCCSMCNLTFCNKYSFKKHMQLQHVTNECRFCKVTLGSSTLYLAHMRSFHRDSIFKCTQCTYKTFVERHYLAHMQMHENYLSCPYEDCKDNFANNRLLESHINKFHRQVKPYKCDIEGCELAFYAYKDFAKHKVIAHNVYVYTCHLCDYKTNGKYSWTSHQNQHTGAKPFKCTEEGCWREFRSKTQLNSHLRHRHSSERPFPCEVADCTKSFKSKGHVTSHMKTHKRKFEACEECGKKYLNRANLREHLVVEHDKVVEGLKEKEGSQDTSILLNSSTCDEDNDKNDLTPRECTFNKEVINTATTIVITSTGCSVVKPNLPSTAQSSMRDTLLD